MEIKEIMDRQRSLECNTMPNRALILICLFLRNTYTQNTNMTCGEHQEFRECGSCERSCFDQAPICLTVCVSGCFCVEDYLRAPDGSCVLQDNCPEAEVTFGSIEASIEECQADEVFVWCGWCEASCSDPTPDCGTSTCIRGCFCKPNLLRHYSGHCVEPDKCLPQNCTNPNEEYSCKHGCALHCEPRAAACERARRCRLGCHCRRGLYRNRDGLCVTHQQCLDTDNLTVHV